MKVHSYFFSFLCILILSSCKKEIVSEDIYGVWAMQEQSTTSGPQFSKLRFDKEYGSWIDPVVSDTIFYFKKIALNGDTLLLTDGFDQPTQCIIEELHDSVLTLSHIDGFDKEVTYKKVYDNSVKPLEKISYSDLPEDSLDVIVKSFIVWDFYQYQNTKNKEQKIYHSLTKAEMTEAKELLRRYMTDGSLQKDQYYNEDAYPFDQYIRQYESYMTNGHLYVGVTLNTYVRTSAEYGYTILKQDLCWVHDGGPAHARATIDLTAKKVTYFDTNGI